MVAKKDLHPNAPILANNITRPVLVERGSINRIFVINDNVVMTVTGAKALQSGKKGDLVMFDNPMNDRKNLQARVIKEGVALINLK